MNVTMSDEEVRQEQILDKHKKRLDIECSHHDTNYRFVSPIIYDTYLRRQKDLYYMLPECYPMKFGLVL